MRAFRHLPMVLVASGSVACTALLGSFDVSNDTPSTPDTDGGGDGSSGGNQEGGGPLGLSPVEAKVGILRAQAFTAATAVTWSIQEGAGGGSIDATGKYISPDKAGTFHIIATSKADAKVTSMGTVTVVPLGMNVLVGKPGGGGNIDGPVARARLRDPQGVGFLGNGSSTLIVADTGNHTIRKVVGATVSTVAGKSGVVGHANGTGAAASFDTPRAVAADDNGKKVWVVDGQGTCVRRVDVDTGAVTTFAGTCGTGGHADSTDNTGATALFDRIDTMVLGAQKDALYICDINNFRGIRKVDAVTGKTTSPVTGLNNSCTMAADYFSHYLFYNDNNNTNDIRRLPDPIVLPPSATSVCSPLLNNVGQIHNAFLGMAADTGFGNQNDIYVSGYDQSIYKCRLDTNVWEVFAGVAADQHVVDGPVATARFSHPGAMFAYSPQSALYVTDQNVIRHIRTGAGAATTVDTAAGVAGSDIPVDGNRATARLTFPFGVAMDDSGNAYIADVGFDSATNNTIRKFDAATATVSPLAGAKYRYQTATPPMDGTKTDATFGIPFDIVRAGTDVFVLDLYGQAIRRVSIATGDVKTIAGELGVLGNSNGVGAAAHFKLVDPMSNSNTIGTGLATDGTNLYVSDAGNFAIRKVVIATGTVSLLAGGTMGTANGTGATAQFMVPGGLAYDNGVLYVTDLGDHTIRKVDVKTGEVTSFIGLSGVSGDIDGDASMATLNAPARVVADGLGNLFFTESPSVAFGTGLIRRVDIKARKVVAFAGTLGQSGFSSGPLPATVNCPSSLTIAKNGDLVFGDACDGMVGVISPL